jgi:F0F1-type ATP synthase membrane subunit b/b'
MINNRTKILILTIFSISLPLKVLAASDGSIPVGTVVSQIMNLAVLFALIYFSQRTTIAQYFKQRREDYIASLEAATLSKTQAEETLNEVSERLNRIQQTFEQQIKEAESNAEQSYQTQVKKALEESERIKNQAKTGLEFETLKQIENLRIETFRRSAEMAENDLSQNLTPEQKRAWNSHFSMMTEGAH